MARVAPTAFWWSGGKDSALALGRLLDGDTHDVQCLVTMVDGAASTVHEIGVDLLQAQAEAIGLPLRTVEVGDRRLAACLQEAAVELRRLGYEAVGFGDLDHGGARVHREADFGAAGLTVVEPLGGLSSAEVMGELVTSGIEAITVVVDAAVLGAEFLGRPIDRAFLRDLPAGCDPCGELGEYHSFVVSAPYFGHAVGYRLMDRERVDRTIATTAGAQTFSSWRVQVV